MIARDAKRFMDWSRESLNRFASLGDLAIS
jgi:hypothetical protein